MILDCYQSAGDRSRRRHGPRRRLRRRRLGEVAVRRAGERLAVRAARPRGDGSSPTSTGWQAHERPFAFEEEMEYASGAARFLTGTPNPAAHMAGTAGYDLIEEIGVERIRENSLRQTELLIGLADAAGFDVRSPRDPARRGGTVTIDAPEAARRLRRARVARHPRRLPSRSRNPPRRALLHDRRRAALRGRQIVEIVETGAYERHLGAAALH